MRKNKKAKALFLAFGYCLSISTGNSFNIGLDSEKGNYCPFGACKGSNPTTLYASKEQAEIFLSYSSYRASNVNFKLSEKWSFLEFINNKGEDLSEFAVEYSKKTGVCSSQLSMFLPKDLHSKLVPKIKSVLLEETGHEPEKIQISRFKDYDNNKWTDVAIGGLKGVDTIFFNYSNKSVTPMGYWNLNIAIWYDNFSECRKYEKEIPAIIK